MTPRTKTRLADQHLNQFREQQRQLDDLHSLRLGIYRQIESLDASGDTGSERRKSLESSVAQIDEQISELNTAASATRRTLRVIGIDVADSLHGTPAYA